MTSMQHLAADVPLMLALFICGAVGYFVTRLMKPRIVASAQQCKKVEPIVEDDGTPDDVGAPAVKRNAQTRRRNRREANATPQQATDSVSTPVATCSAEEELPTPQINHVGNIIASGPASAPAAATDGDVVAQILPAAVVSTRVDKIMAKKALRKVRKSEESKAEVEQAVTRDEVLVARVTEEVTSVLEPTAACDTTCTHEAVPVDSEETPAQCSAEDSIAVSQATLDEETPQTDSASVPSDDVETSCPSTCEIQVDKGGAQPKTESEDEQNLTEDLLTSVVDADQTHEEQQQVALDDMNEQVEEIEQEDAEDAQQVGQWAVYDSDDEKDLVVEYSHVPPADDIAYAGESAAHEEDRQESLPRGTPVVQRSLSLDQLQSSMPWLVENETETLEAWKASNRDDFFMNTSEPEHAIWDAPHWGGSSKQASQPEFTVWDAPHWGGPAKMAPGFEDGWMLPLDEVLATHAMAQADLHGELMQQSCSWDENAESTMCEIDQPNLDLGPSLQKILSEVGHAPADDDAALVYMVMSPTNANPGCEENSGVACEDTEACS